MTAVTIPKSVYFISGAPFALCSNLSEVYLKGNHDFQTYNASFRGCSALKTIYGNEGSNTQAFVRYLNIKSYSLDYVAVGSDFVLPSPAITTSASPSSASVKINGSGIAFQAYTIGGNNYFKLRDIAMALNGTSKQFDVSWDGAKNAIILSSDKPYAPVGGELMVSGSTDSTTASISSSVVYLGIFPVGY